MSRGQLLVQMEDGSVKPTGMSVDASGNIAKSEISSTLQNIAGKAADVAVSQTGQPEAYVNSGTKVSDQPTSIEFQFDNTAGAAPKTYIIGDASGLVSRDRAVRLQNDPEALLDQLQAGILALHTFADTIDTAADVAAINAAGVTLKAALGTVKTAITDDATVTGSWDGDTLKVFRALCQSKVIQVGRLVFTSVNSADEPAIGFYSAGSVKKYSFNVDGNSMGVVPVKFPQNADGRKYDNSINRLEGKFYTFDHNAAIVLVVPIGYKVTVSMEVTAVEAVYGLKPIG